MMGPMKVPVIHNRAFGHLTMFPTAPVPHARMGEPPGPTIDGDTLQYQKSLTYYEGIRDNFKELSSLVGEKAAMTALSQAKGAYERSLKAWTASKPARF